MASHLEALRADARALPRSPGVYLWQDSRDRTLYVGKAVNLRSRVTSYFSTAKHDGRIRELVTRARAIRHEPVATELEALIRESALIKRLQPPFNRALRTSRRPYYLKFDRRLTDPYMETAREIEDDESLYFGPFQSGAVLRETMQFLHDVLPLRKCRAVNPRCRPCIYFQMGKCAAPMLDAQHRRQHEEAIDRMHDLLDGRSDRVVAWLEAKRNRLSESLLYEQAAEVQARLDALHQLLRRQTILQAALQSRCVLLLVAGENGAEPRLLLVAHGNVISMRDPGTAGVEQLGRWVTLHEPIIRATRAQTELDAADVMSRWLAGHRDRVRWVTVPAKASEDELRDRIAYLLAATAARTASAGERVAAGA